MQLNNNRGMALLITLTVMTLLIAGALEMNRRVRTAVEATAASRDRQTLTQMAYAGVHVAMAMLIKDKKQSPVDSIQEDWADPEKIAEVLQEIPMDKGRITFSITDEMGKIQVNALVDFPKGRHFKEPQKIMWDRFTRNLIEQNEDLEDTETDAATIVNSVKDWLDSEDDDATTGLSGAEADYYEGLEPPYAPANGPFRHIDELMQVKGMIPALFGGTKQKENTDFPSDFFGGMPDTGSPDKYMTVYGMSRSAAKVNDRTFTFEGKININTAELPVLLAIIPSENADYARAIYDYRNEKEDGEFVNTNLSSPAWYKNVPDIPGDLNIDPNLITVSSDYFRITATAGLHDKEMKLSVVVHREQNKKGKWICRVLSWQPE
ncbi:MAG: general secretion pathway protein GspK [Desulfococcaceae bacterium]|jgi:general secretion pathway protein K|nr:general secretion pathway protein GspK [Desulfococcaceae bacterium]